MLEYGGDCIFWSYTTRLDHFDGDNAFGDCNVSADQIHSPHTNKTLAGRITAYGHLLDDLRRVGRLGVI